MKLVAIGLGIVGALAIAVPAAQADTGFCLKRSFDGDRVTCVASASEDNADLGRVRAGARSRVLWALRCEKGAHESVQRGFLGRGDVMTITPELNNADCILRAKARSHRRAFTRVALV